MQQSHSIQKRLTAKELVGENGLPASFQVGMDSCKEQKQGRAKNTQEDYLIMECWQKKKDKKTTCPRSTVYAADVG